MNMAPNTEWIENVTYDELSVGQSARLLRTLTQADIQAFAAVSGDTNPAHLNPEYANDTLFHGVIAHGMWGGALISALLVTVTVTVSVSPMRTGLVKCSTCSR